jgi:hypothetical protein
MKKETKKDFDKFIEELAKEELSAFLRDSGLFKKIFELESLRDYFRIMLGVELDIKVKPVKPKKGRWRKML